MNQPELLNKKIAIFGDIILDQYTFGSINRISPEAPVPVVEVKKSELKLGGAGNVLLNLADLGMSCVLYSRIGNDKNGSFIECRLNELNIEHELLHFENHLPTITKTRVIAGNQQILRMDEECIADISNRQETIILEKFKAKVKHLNAVVLSDYGKGFLTERLCQHIIDIARQSDIPVIIDPKGIDFSKYKNGTVITPNYKEAQSTYPAITDIEELAKNIIKQTALDFLLITRSQDGISHFSLNGDSIQHINYPVDVQEVTDVTGAGDTVVAVTTMSLANKLDTATLCKLCNLAGGYVVGHFGAATISSEELLKLYNQSYGSS